MGPLKDSLRNLRNRNQDKWSLRILSTSFVFEDIEVVIGGISDEEISEMPSLFKFIQSVSDLMLYPGSMSLKKIEMPAVFLPTTGGFDVDSGRINPCRLSESVWIVTYQDNEQRLFDAKDKVFIEVSELERSSTLL